MDKGRLFHNCEALAANVLPPSVIRVMVRAESNSGSADLRGEKARNVG